MGPEPISRIFSMSSRRGTGGALARSGRDPSPKSERAGVRPIGNRASRRTPAPLLFTPVVWVTRVSRPTRLPPRPGLVLAGKAHGRRPDEIGRKARHRTEKEPLLPALDGKRPFRHKCRPQSSLGRLARPLGADRLSERASAVAPGGALEPSERPNQTTPLVFWRMFSCPR
jgi:hypothetical protein